MKMIQPASRTHASLGRLITTAGFIACGESHAQEQAFVKVRMTKIKSRPDFLSSSVGELREGNSITVLGRENAWVKIKNGYIHESAVSDKQVALRSSGSAGSDSSDLVLASKGFDSETEKRFAQQNPEVNFREVDNMEKIQVGEKDLISFIKAGKLGKEG
jgi:uncharacterized protein YaaQ